MADENRTEKATGRRRQKLREKGQIARSRELPAALAILGLVVFVSWQAVTWLGQWRVMFSDLLAEAAPGESFAVTHMLQQATIVALRWTLPALVTAWALSALGHVVQGGVVVAPKALAPDFNKLNPATNLQKLFSFGAVNGVLKSLVPMFFITYVVVGIFGRDWINILYSGHVNPTLASGWGLDRVFEIAWKAGLVFLMWGMADYLLEKFNFERQIRMSRQEIKEEGKETEGNPEVKTRIRRLQRKMHRRFLTRDVGRATVVITNPTEYAVALEYRVESMAAPVVVAKGRNLLARRIRQEATWHGIPIIENPPLAQALYRAVEVGQAIPTKLYAAVAEILAFIFRAQGRAVRAPNRAPEPRVSPRV